MITKTYLLFLLAFPVLSLQGSPPNIVYILADDMGYGDVSAFNPESKIQTPHIDTLAAQGMRFTDMHSPSSVCTPTRYGILTGQYCWRSSLKVGVTRGYGRVFMEEGRQTVAQLLHEHGYRTGVVGKWHLGLDWQLKPGAAADPRSGAMDIDENGVVKDIDPALIDFSKPVTRGPRDFGFDYSFVLPASLDMPPYCYVRDHELVQAPTSQTPGNDLDQGFMGAFWRGGEMAPDFDFWDVLPRFTREAVDFINKSAHDDRPFFLYLPLAAPHTPWVPTPEWEGASQAGPYGDFVEMVDAEIGRVIAALDEAGVAENTLVIFTSDNGPYWIPRDIERYGHRSAAHFRGMKGDIWEGGHRIPYVARWPGKIEAGTVSNALSSLTHLIATAANIVGEPEPNRFGEDSFSILPVLLGHTNYVSHQPGIMMHSSRARFAWREGDWKFIEGRGSGGFSAPVEFEVRMGEPSDQLYHLGHDPSESDNLFYRHPEKVAEFQRKLNQVRGFSRN